MPPTTPAESFLFCCKTRDDATVYGLTEIDSYVLVVRIFSWSVDRLSILSSDSSMSLIPRSRRNSITNYFFSVLARPRPSVFPREKKKKTPATARRRGSHLQKAEKKKSKPNTPHPHTLATPAVAVTLTSGPARQTPPRRVAKTLACAYRVRPVCVPCAPSSLHLFVVNVTALLRAGCWTPRWSR